MDLNSNTDRAPTVAPDPERGGATLHLPEITYLDTQGWSADVGLTDEGLAGLRVALGVAAGSVPEGVPCSVPPCESGSELCAAHERLRAHEGGEHESCGIECETQIPSHLLRNTILCRAFPGAPRMLDELLRRAAAGVLPVGWQNDTDELTAQHHTVDGARYLCHEGDHYCPPAGTVAYRHPDWSSVLLCRAHGAGRSDLVPLTSEDLPDGGTCTRVLPGGVCGVDVLIPPAS